MLKKYAAEADGSSPATADDRLAAALAEEAGRLLIDIRRTHPGGGRPLGDVGDRRSNELILQRLAEHRPDDAVLSEESTDLPARLGASRVWIVDPLDGTREYGEPDRRDWAVHVALVEGGALVAGAVALPAESVVLSTGGGLPPLGPPAGVPRMVVSRSRPPSITAAIRTALGAELVPLGSAGAKAMAVVRGHAEVYAHAGGQFEWDSAAPVAVAAAAGLWVSRLDGSPLVYNCPDPWLPDLLICRQELAPAVLTAAN